MNLPIGFHVGNSFPQITVYTNDVLLSTAHKIIMVPVFPGPYYAAANQICRMTKNLARMLYFRTNTMHVARNLTCFRLHHICKVTFDV